MNLLEVKNLSVAYGDLTIVRDVSFSVEAGQWMILAGPNGAGKSTIVNAVAGTAPHCGTVRLLGRDMSGMKPREIARHMGVLAQSSYVGYAYTVREVVSLGRYAAGRRFFGRGSDEDERMVERALSMTGLAGQRDQSVLTLSGGELQRTFLAQVLAQDPDLLILDEPTNHLDLKYQQQVFDLIREWVKQPGKAVLSVVHDLSLALTYGTDALLLSGGSVAARGTPREALGPEHLASAYGMDVYDWMKRMLGVWTT